MVNRISGPARNLLSARERLDREEIERSRRTGALVVDERRRRPLYFDGRFLAARDLTRDQSYFLARQADLGRAIGVGVVSGLMVAQGADVFSVSISPGQGVTQSGELVVLPGPLNIRLADAPEIQRLNVAFRLSHIPATPPRAHAGLFILALRAVEFTANPIASYPTSINGTRSVEDGDIIEGVAVSLIPFRDEGASGEMGQRRALAAREIFVAGGDGASPLADRGGVLPLAMLALDRSGVHWIDPYLVRREVGAEHGDILSFGFAPRAQREAFLFQYEQHLAEIMALRGSTAGGQRFAATDYFYALPPAGHMPAASINTSDFTQTYFPPEVDVELSIIPQDEIPALLEESMRLPPLDLALSGEELESTSVVVLIPVERHRLRGIKSRLESLRNQLRPAAPGLVARRKPIEALQGLRVARLLQPIVRPEALADAVWVEELNRAAAEGGGLLWYMRRRNLSYKAEVVGVPVRVEGDEVNTERNVGERISELARSGLTPRFEDIRASATSRANAEIVSALSSPVFSGSRLLLAGAMHEMEAAVREQPVPSTETGEARLTSGDVIRVTERFAAPESGEGIASLEAIRPEIASNDAIVSRIVETDMVPELDRVARTLPEAEREAFAERLVETANTGDTESVRRLISDTQATLRMTRL